MRQFVAMINGSTNSGLKDTKEKAIDWAQEQLSTNPKYTVVHICETVATVQRAAPPITVHDIPAHDIPYLGNGKDHTSYEPPARDF